MKKNFVLSVAMLSAMSLPMFAQAPSTEPPISQPPAASPGQRYENQQDRIAAGIKDGELTPTEAAKLEREESRLRQKATQLKAQNGGTLTPSEQTRLNNIQNRLSHQIKKDENNGATTNYGKGVVGSRQENQQDRIAQGVNSGQLTAGEAGRLENKESQLNGEIKQDRNANGGKLTQAERQQVRQQQNQLSKQIYKDKNNNRRNKK